MVPEEVSSFVREWRSADSSAQASDSGQTMLFPCSSPQYRWLHRNMFVSGVPRHAVPGCICDCVDAYYDCGDFDCRDPSSECYGCKPKVDWVQLAVDERVWRSAPYWRLWTGVQRHVHQRSTAAVETILKPSRHNRCWHPPQSWSTPIHIID